MARPGQCAPCIPAVWAQSPGWATARRHGCNHSLPADVMSFTWATVRTWTSMVTVSNQAVCASWLTRDPSAERTMDAGELSKHKGRTLVLSWPDEAGEGPFAKLVCMRTHSLVPFLRVELHYSHRGHWHVQCVRRWGGASLVCIGEWAGATFGSFAPGIPAHGQVLYCTPGG
jgi:hypothetical protein